LKRILNILMDLCVSIGKRNKGFLIKFETKIDFNCKTKSKISNPNMVHNIQFIKFSQKRYEFKKLIGVQTVSYF